MSFIKKISEKILRPILYTAYTLKSKNVSFADKAKICGAIIYTIIPSDFIPDFIPVAGYCDDFATLIWAIHTIRKNVTPEIKQKTQKKIAGWF